MVNSYRINAESNLSLLNTLVSSGPTTKTSKTNLRNILMQSRKCVQHPYLIDNDLEPVAKSNLEMHRQLIDASGKLKFLEIMLRNLKARGRRVLLFSQVSEYWQWRQARTHLRPLVCGENVQTPFQLRANFPRLH